MFRTHGDLLNQAREQNQAYRQYDDKFDQWCVCQINKDIRTKLGQAFVKGDYALYNPDSAEMNIGEIYGRDSGKVFVTVYSWRNKIQTTVPVKATSIQLDPAILAAVQADAEAREQAAAAKRALRKKTVSTIGEALAVARAALEAGETCGIFPRNGEYLVNKDIVQMF